MSNKLKNGTHEPRVTYANSIVKLMRQEFNIRNEFSRDYEGDPTKGAVKVPTRNNDIKLSDYDILNGVTMTQSATEYLDVLVNNHKGFSELCDGYEAAAVPDNLKAQRLESAGYATGKALEESAIDALITGGKTLEDTTALSANATYAYIAEIVTNMKKRGIKVTEMRIAISADIELNLLTDEKFSNSASTLGADLIREGVIGKVAGVATKPNYLLPDNVEFIVYAKPWCQAIDGWKVPPDFKDIADGNHIGACSLQGRMIYKDIVTNELAVTIKTVKTATEPVTPPIESGGPSNPETVSNKNEDTPAYSPEDEFTEDDLDLSNISE